MARPLHQAAPPRSLGKRIRVPGAGDSSPYDLRCLVEGSRWPGRRRRAQRGCRQLVTEPEIIGWASKLLSNSAYGRERSVGRMRARRRTWRMANRKWPTADARTAEPGGPRGCCSAFTLIELMVVIVLI